jgi:hypothetical protein
MVAEEIVWNGWLGGSLEWPTPKKSGIPSVCPQPRYLEEGSATPVVVVVESARANGYDVYVYLLIPAMLPRSMVIE